MTRTRTTTSRPRGFSLLELTLALAIAAVLALTLYTSLTVTFRAKRSAEAAIGPARSMVIALDLIGRDLQSALPPTGILGGAFTGTQQTGTDADSLSFYCVGEDVAPDGVERPLVEGIRRVGLVVQTDVTPAVPVRRVERNLLASVTRDPDEEVLCRNVKSFTLRYYDGLSWVEAWDSTPENTLPLAVSVSIELVGEQMSGVTRARAYRMTRIIPLSCGTDVGAIGDVQ